MNPIAIALWIFCGLVGYLIGEWRGAIIGVTISVGLSITASLYTIYKRGW